MMNFFSKPKPPHGTPFVEGDLKIIARALQIAWDHLNIFEYHSNPPFNAAVYDDEDDVTSRMVEILNRMLESDEVEGFNLSVFQSFHRDAKLSSKSRGIDKMPDITVCLQEAGVYSPKYHQLEIECKVIKKRHSSQSVINYVRKGMHRFIDRQYSHYSSVAMMCAYTVEAYEPQIALEKYFRTAKQNDPGIKCLPLGKIRPFLYNKYSLKSQAIQTEHDRGDPTQFKIVHLWLYKS